MAISLVALLLLSAKCAGDSIADPKIWVDPVHGHDKSNCAPQAHPCKSLNFAVNQIASLGIERGGVVRLMNGLYLGECSELGIPVHQPITIVCEAAGECVIDCEFDGRLFNLSKQSGTISKSTPSLNMTNVDVVNGSTTTVNGGGAAVYASAGCSLSFHRCHFANHIATNINTHSPSTNAPVDSKIQGGGAVFIDLAMGAQLVVTKSSFENCTVTGHRGNNHTSRGYGNMGGGLCVRLAGAISAAADSIAITPQEQQRTVFIQESNFTNCAAAFGGGAFVGSGGSTAVDSVTIVVETSIFQHCTAHAGSGGGIAIFFHGCAANVFASFTACQICHNIAAGENGYSQGGGIFYKFRAAAANTTLIINTCRVAENVAHGGVHGNQGGGICAYYTAEHKSYNSSIVGYTNTSVIVMESNITNNVAGSNSGKNNGYGLGGGMIVGNNAPAMSTSVVIVGCQLSENSAYGIPNAQGGGITVYHGDTAIDTSVLISACTFRDNAVEGRQGYGTGGAIFLQYSGAARNASLTLNSSSFVRNNASTKGGALYFYFQPPPTEYSSTISPPSLNILDCTFTTNTAKEYGGAMYAEQTNIPLPENLNMSVKIDQNYAVNRTCDAIFSGIQNARQWQEGTTLVLVNRSSFSNNTARGIDGDSSDRAFGGAMHIINVNAAIYRSNITGNRAVEENAVGGAISLGPGIASLVLEDTTVSNNSCTGIGGILGGGTGATIYSASGGSIKMQGATNVTFATRTAGADMTILSGGKVEYRNSTVLQCPIGHVLRYGVRSYAQAYDDWKIDCSVIKSDDDGKAMYANPTCKQLQKQKNTHSGVPGVLYTYPCNGLPLSPAMLMTAGQVSCSPCAPSLYSLDQATHSKNALHKVQCLPCPYGANCTEGGAELRVKAGFWGLKTVDSDSGLPLAEIKLCPVGYCCKNTTAGCAWDGNDACQGNRNRSVPLCGGCQTHFSQSIDGTSCVQNDACGGHSAAAYASVQLLYWCLVAMYGLYQARYPPVLSIIPRHMHPPERNNGGVSATLYFLQMAMVAVPQGSTLASQMAMSAGNVANIQQLSNGKEMCLLQGMTMVHRLVWQLFAPLMPMLTLALFVLVLGVSGRFTKDNTRSPSRTSFVSRLRTSFVSRLHGPGSSRAGNRSSTDGGIAAGVACLMLLSFSSFSTATLKLLNCQRVDKKRVLFFAGATKCGAWQLPIFLLLIFLILVPLVPVCVSVLCQLPRSWWLSRWAHARRWPSYPVMQAIRQHALEPFEHEQRHWAAVLLLQRLLTVACHSLASSELETELGVTVVSVWFLLLQALVKPYRVQWVNTLQLVAGWCLVMLTVLNSASNSVFVSVGVDVSSTPFKILDSTANSLMVALLFPPLFMLPVFTAVDAGWGLWWIGGRRDTDRNHSLFDKAEIYNDSNEGARTVSVQLAEITRVSRLEQSIEDEDEDGRLVEPVQGTGTLAGGRSVREELMDPLLAHDHGEGDGSERRGYERLVMRQRQLERENRRLEQEKQLMEEQKRLAEEQKQQAEHERDEERRRHALDKQLAADQAAQARRYGCSSQQVQQQEEGKQTGQAEEQEQEQGGAAAVR
jgi:predicted outer membrane repeat protein